MNTARLSYRSYMSRKTAADCLRTILCCPALLAMIGCSAPPHAAPPNAWDGMVHVKIDNNPEYLTPAPLAEAGAPCDMNVTPGSGFARDVATGDMLVCGGDPLPISTKALSIPTGDTSP